MRDTRYGYRARRAFTHLAEVSRGRTVAHIIVVGNEKGGAGKSTVSMHVATALARMGHATGVIDLDLRQRVRRCGIIGRGARTDDEGGRLDGADPAR